MVNCNCISFCFQGSELSLVEAQVMESMRNIWPEYKHRGIASTPELWQFEITQNVSYHKATTSEHTLLHNTLEYSFRQQDAKGKPKYCCWKIGIKVKQILCGRLSEKLAPFNDSMSWNQGKGNVLSFSICPVDKIAHTNVNSTSSHKTWFNLYSIHW